jgi:hypothetical protein
MPAPTEWCSAALCTLVVAAPLARAAEPPATTPTVPTATRPTATAPAGDVPSNERIAAAQEAYRAGRALYAQGDQAGALAEFQKAYDLLPTYEVLASIGQVSEELGLWARSRRAFELYLKLGGNAIKPKTVTAVRKLLEELESKTATLSVTMNVSPDEVLIDSNPVETNELRDLVLEPGTHLIIVRKPGFQPLQQSLAVQNGEHTHWALELSPVVPPIVREPAGILEPSRASPRMSPWVPWSITGVLGAGWATTAVLAIKAQHDRHLIERPTTSAQRIDDARNLELTLAVVSDVLLASTLTAAGVSAYITWWSADAPPDPSPRVSTKGEPQARGTWGLGATGHF